MTIQPMAPTLQRVSFGHPDAIKLNDRVQLEYAERYGDDGDVTPLDPTMFDAPRGLYLIAYDDGAPRSPPAAGAPRSRTTRDIRTATPS